ESLAALRVAQAHPFEEGFGDRIVDRWRELGSLRDLAGVRQPDRLLEHAELAGELRHGRRRRYGDAIAVMMPSLRRLGRRFGGVRFRARLDAVLGVGGSQ